jgi:hypothetical protein
MHRRKRDGDLKRGVTIQSSGGNNAIFASFASMVRFTVAIDCVFMSGSFKNLRRSCLSISRVWRRVLSSLNVIIVLERVACIWIAAQVAMNQVSHHNAFSKIIRANFTESNITDVSLGDGCEMSSRASLTAAMIEAQMASVDANRSVVRRCSS